MKKKSLSAIVAVLAMLMTSVSVSSCSSDDDDDSTTTTPTLLLSLEQWLRCCNSRIFLVNQGRKDLYFYSKCRRLKDVEIVFNGTNFVTAASSANSTVSTNGNSATLTTNANGTIAYVTSTGYMGTITYTWYKWFYLFYRNCNCYQGCKEVILADSN